MSFIIYNDDCLTRLGQMEDASVDAIVTDPPYGLSFMGKKWDYDVPGVDVWAECLRVLKPGGHLLAFAGTRTQHRMAVRIEDAGFEIRDMIAWVYGSGFPKSLDVSKAIDKAAGAEREVLGVAGKSGSVRNSMAGDFAGGEYMETSPATESARQWQGWGTALKPALEPITVARKPLDGTVAANVLQHGTGALNIDGCRVHSHDSEGYAYKVQRMMPGAGQNATGKTHQEGVEFQGHTKDGRWPANICHDGSDEVVAGFPVSNGSGPARTLKRGQRDGEGWGMADEPGALRDAGTGSAARFFYCAKASKADRDAGLEHIEATERVNGNKWTDQDYRVANGERSEGRESGPRKNIHPTVKPTDLMAYLVRLVTPPGGVVLDPFMGSGSTGKAAVLEGFQFIGIERDVEYCEIANARIQAANDNQPRMADLFGAKA